MLNRALTWLGRHPLLAGVLAWCVDRLPLPVKLRKYANAVSAFAAFANRATAIRSRPVWVRIAPTAVCNYRCLFCEIHKDNVLYPNRARNEIGLHEIRSLEGLLKWAYSVSFFGGSEEPLLSKQFGDIARYLKETFSIKLMVNTNASVLGEDLARCLVDCEFDYIIVSYHAGTPGGYKAIMTGKQERVDRNLSYLRDYKKTRQAHKPMIAFNFALQKLSADEYESIIEKAKQLDVDHVIVNHYYGGRNRLQDQKVSFEYDVDEGNRILDGIYTRARERGVSLLPRKPPYWQHKADSIEWVEDDVDDEIVCHLPWTHIHFNPVLDRANAHYVGVCNRAELFRYDYQEQSLQRLEEVDAVWNHPALRYLRETVNMPKESMNPLCRFCKNRRREALRNVDADAYAEKRDTAVERFLEICRQKTDGHEKSGLELLADNPHADGRFVTRLEALRAAEISTREEANRVGAGVDGR
jgi:MoaA/NifB/PqqE/SkfB family radical SAM enzyme